MDSPCPLGFNAVDQDELAAPGLGPERQNALVLRRVVPGLRRGALLVLVTLPPAILLVAAGHALTRL